MKQYLKTEGKLLLNHFAVWAVVLVFGPMLGFEIGAIIFNIVFTAFYFGLMYGTAWRAAKSDIGVRPSGKPYAAKGLVFGLIHSAVILGVGYLLYLFRSNLVVRAIYLAWTMPIFNWYWYFNKEILPLILTMLILPIAPVFGYYMGMKKRSFYHDFVYPVIYKSEKKQDG